MYKLVVNGAGKCGRNIIIVLFPQYMMYIAVFCFLGWTFGADMLKSNIVSDE